MFQKKFQNIRRFFIKSVTPRKMCRFLNSFGLRAWCVGAQLPVSPKSAGRPQIVCHVVTGYLFFWLFLSRLEQEKCGTSTVVQGLGGAFRGHKKSAGLWFFRQDIRTLIIPLFRSVDNLVTVALILKVYPPVVLKCRRPTACVTKNSHTPLGQIFVARVTSRYLFFWLFLSRLEQEKCGTSTVVWGPGGAILGRCKNGGSSITSRSYAHFQFSRIFTKSLSSSKMFRFLKSFGLHP